MLKGKIIMEKTSIRYKNLCIYGAAEAGIQFLKKQKIIDNYRVVFFADKNKFGTIVEGIEVKLPNEVENCDVIITCRDFTPVYKWLYEQKNVYVIGIYDSECNLVYDYKTACSKKYQTYSNNESFDWEIERKVKKQNNLKKYLNGTDLMECIGAVYFELSNICNYACIHHKCPLSKEKEKIIMPMAQIKMILNELAEISFSGSIGFYIYNEPLIDPRLFYLIGLAKNILPNCAVEITTNAFYLNQLMIDELTDIGCDRITASAYGQSEFDRLIKYEAKIPFSVYSSYFDDRLDNYADREEPKKNIPCSSFIDFVGIASDGELYFCCMDYKKNFSLGNVFEKGLRPLLKEESINKYTRELNMGNRSICNLCKNCEMEF